MELRLHSRLYLKLYLKSSTKIVIDLWSEVALNTMNNLIYMASRGWIDHHVIRCIAPGKWADLSYNVFGYEECRYPIPDEFRLDSSLEPLTPRPGIICMGSCDEAGLVSAEIFFPLKELPGFRGIYPVLGEAIEGTDEVRRITKLPACGVTYPDTDKEIPEFVKPQIIRQTESGPFGETYPASMRMEKQNLSPYWR